MLSAMRAQSAPVSYKASTCFPPGMVLRIVGLVDCCVNNEDTVVTCHADGGLAAVGLGAVKGTPISSFSTVLSRSSS